MGGLVDAVFGDGQSTSNTTVTSAPPTEEEKALIALNTQLAQKQLDNINALQPFQKQLLDYSASQLSNQQAYDKALNAAISPEDQAAAAKEQFDQARALGPMQTQLAQMQLDALKQGGAATDEQKQRIAEATDTALQAGYGDIDTQTKRGIGLISDELANSRGLRLSDSPISSEAALLVRAAGDQKSSLTNNLRANQASATLNYPLAVAGLMSGINSNQQTMSSAAENFQAQLRQQAYQNRLALSGQATNSGIGLATVGSGAGTGTLGALTSVRGKSVSGTSFDPAAIISSYGNLARGIGMAGAGGPR